MDITTIKEIMHSDEAMYILGVIAAAIFIIIVTLRIHRNKKNSNQEIVTPFAFRVGVTPDGQYHIDEVSLQALSDVEPIYCCKLKHDWTPEYKETRMKAVLKDDSEENKGQREAICKLLENVSYSITDMQVDSDSGRGRTIAVHYFSANGSELNVTADDKIRWVDMTINPINLAILKRIRIAKTDDDRVSRMAMSTVAAASAMSALSGRSDENNNLKENDTTE